MYDGPVREGNRGGQGDFRWSAVSDDKHRENYLGHSVNAPVGRWQKNKDIHWYTREVEASDTGRADRERQEEIKRLKEAEEDALALALGIAPKQRDQGDAGGEGSGANSVPVKGGEDEEREVRKREKELRREQRALKRAEREVKREEKDRVKDERRSQRRSEPLRHRDDDRHRGGRDIDMEDRSRRYEDDRGNGRYDHHDRYDDRNTARRPTDRAFDGDRRKRRDSRSDSTTPRVKRELGSNSPVKREELSPRWLRSPYRNGGARISVNDRTGRRWRD